MKSITPYLLKFATVALILTLVFRFFLSYTLAAELFTLVWVVAMSYGLASLLRVGFLGEKMPISFHCTISASDSI